MTSDKIQNTNFCQSEANMLDIVTCLIIKMQCKKCASDDNVLTNVTSNKIQMQHKVFELKLMGWPIIPVITYRCITKCEHQKLIG